MGDWRREGFRRTRPWGTLLVAVLGMWLGAAAFAELVINEVDPDQAGKDLAEFIELYDGGLGSQALDGYVLVLVNGSRDSLYRIFDLEGMETSENGFFVIGAPGIPHVDWIIDPGASGALQNGPDGVALYRRPASSFAVGQTVDGEGLVDAIVYGTGDAVDRGLLDVLLPGGQQVDDSPDHSLSRVADGVGDAGGSVALRVPTPGVSNVISEHLTLTLAENEVREGAGPGAVSIEVKRSGPLASPLTVTLSVSDASELEALEALHFESGQAELSVALSPVDDLWPDGKQLVELTARALGFQEARESLWVVDDDPPEALRWIINEVYADDREDANGDMEGAGDGPGMDEFVEIVNVSGEGLDLSGHTLSDALALRHTFPQGTVIPAGCAVVVFGGGEVVEGPHPAFGGAWIQRANGANRYGLGLNNKGDTLHLADPTGREVAGFRYDDILSSRVGAASMTRFPDLTASVISHLEVENEGAASSRWFSPGLDSLGRSFCESSRTLQLRIDANVVPESGADGPLPLLSIERRGAITEALVVRLETDPPGKFHLPEEVAFAAGELAQSLEVRAVDNEVYEPVINVRIRASAVGFAHGEVQLALVDDGDPEPRWSINELDVSQRGEDLSEFVEIYDGGVGRAPLDGLWLVCFNGSTGESYASYDLSGHRTTDTGFFVVGDVGVPGVAWAMESFLLQNGPDAVALYREPGHGFSRGSYPQTEGLLDAVVYGTDDAAAVDLLSVLTPGRAQVNESDLWEIELAIGRMPPEAGAGEGEGEVAPYQRVQPTPGEANRGAVLPSPFAVWAEKEGVTPLPDGDPDGDGRSNAMEYLMGTSPRLRDAGAPWTWSKLGLENAVTLAFPLPEVLPEGVRYGFEWSPDLLHWSPLEVSESQWVDGLFSAGFSEFLTLSQTSFIRMVINLDP